MVRPIRFSGIPPPEVVVVVPFETQLYTALETDIFIELVPVIRYDFVKVLRTGSFIVTSEDTTESILGSEAIAFRIS